MKQIPKISEAEWEVMNVLWKKERLTAAQVFEELRERDWKLNTVRTFLTRLEKKKAVHSESLSEARVFWAALSREVCIKAEGETFLKRFFQGATGALLVHFAENRSLSKKDLKELEDIIEQQKKEGNRERR